MSMIMFILSSPGFLWLLGATVLVGMFKPMGLMVVVAIQILLIIFMRYWNQKVGLSRFVKVVVGTTLTVTDITIILSALETWDISCGNKGECGMFTYMISLVLAPVISICFYLLLMRLILKLAHKISLLIVSK